MATRKKANKKATVAKSDRKKTITKKTAVKKTTARRKTAASTAKPRTKSVTKLRKKPGLIGVDPLAWINDAPTKPKQLETAAEENCKPNNKLTMNFSPRFSIREVAANYTQLQQLLDKDVNVELDFQDVDAVDTAALQLLVAFTKEANKRGASITWQQPSAALFRSAELLGLSHELGLPK